MEENTIWKCNLFHGSKYYLEVQPFPWKQLLFGSATFSIEANIIWKCSLFRGSKYYFEVQPFPWKQILFGSVTFSTEENTIWKRNLFHGRKGKNLLLLGANFFSSGVDPNLERMSKNENGRVVSAVNVSVHHKFWGRFTDRILRLLTYDLQRLSSE